MVVCRYYQQGNCRYGDNCKFEHPGHQSSRNTGFASQNRFSAFQSPAGGGTDTARKDLPYSSTGLNTPGIESLTTRRWNISTTEVRNDLTAGKGRPDWILSAYGPGKNPPASLLDGNELSFEELRLRFYDLRAAGNEVQAMNEAQGLWTKAEQQIAEIVQNVDKVVRVMEDADQNRPNRHHFLKMSGTVSKEQIIKDAGSATPFGDTSGVRSNGFGAAAGATGTSFRSSTPASSLGALPFGQSSKPASGQSGFGQTSASSAFRQPSGLGQAGQASGFGSSGFAQPAAKNPFAPASAATFGQPAKPASGFGQPSQPTSGFGQVAFGQTSQPSSGFGQPSQLGTGFGQASKPVTGFGQQSQPPSGFGAGSNPFSGFGGQSKPAAGFGQPSKPSTGFDQPAQLSSGFGQPSQSAPAFGQPAKTTLGFGQPSTSIPNQVTPAFGQALPSQPLDRTPSNPFGSANTTANQPSSSTDRVNPFATTRPSTEPAQFISPPPPYSALPITSTTTATASSLPAASTSAPHPLTLAPPLPIHYTQALPPGQTGSNNQSNRLTTYKSCPVRYVDDKPCYERPDRKGWERIWFSTGPDNVKIEDVQPKDEVFTEEITHAYRKCVETGRFEMGKMPVVPPKREWVCFDF